MFKFSGICLRTQEDWKLTVPSLLGDRVTSKLPFFFVACRPELAADPNKKNVISISESKNFLAHQISVSLYFLACKKCIGVYTSSIIPRERVM